MSTTATKIITLAKAKNSPLIVGVCGGSASGKSTFSDMLMEELAAKGCVVSVINQDDFAIGRHFVNKHTSPYRWDDPNNYRLKECAQAVNDLVVGNTASFMAYTLQTHEPSLRKKIDSQVNVKHPYIIVVEGIFAWYGPMENKVNYKIYLDADFYERFILRLNRNVYESMHTDVDTVIRQYFTHVALAEKDLLSPLKRTADAVITRNIPLPNAVVDGKAPKFIETLYNGSEFSIAINQEGSANLLIYVHGTLAFYIPINDKSIALLKDNMKKDTNG